LRYLPAPIFADTPVGVMIIGMTKFSAPKDPWTAVRDHLEDIRKEIQAEISAYPMPIPGCDVQYNHLLEQRDLILREIGRLEAELKSAAAGDGVTAFIESSVYFGNEDALPSVLGRL